MTMRVKMVASDINSWISDSSDFVLFRYPQQKDVLAALSDATICLATVADLRQITKGFVFAPFADGEFPIIVFNNPKIAKFRQPERKPALTSTSSTENPTDTYSAEFGTFREAVRNGQFSKLVLARTHIASIRSSATDIFFDACTACPNSFVYLFASKESGTWLGATPEILIEGNNRQMHTVALAGTANGNVSTLPDIKEWDSKNQNEQKIVTDYLLTQIQAFGTAKSIIGPNTVRAAHLVHIKTDIFFDINEKDLPQLIAAIHPTPAVCGLPKNEAMRFISQNESAGREYYAGFLGWYDTKADSHLFVNLRCMKWIDNHTVKLMAGGGILPESELESEWNETENKMRTLLNLNSFK
ncbi:MAG: isochorismate synthase [Salinivirgaceae bacterium]|nr:isochorismate synthase [Salinivirgaceae bacterium]